MRGEWVTRVGEWVRSIGEALFHPWPMLGAVATAAALAVVIARLVPFGNDVGGVQFRDVSGRPKVEVITDNAVARARPADDEPIVATLQRGTVVTRLEESGAWTRIELPDGSRVWVRSAHVMLTHTEAR